MKLFAFVPSAMLANAITASDLISAGCVQATQSQLRCPDGSLWAIESLTQTNAFAYFQDTQYPVVSPGGRGAGQICASFSTCEICASQSGCIWATGKCISDVGCLGDPYCADSANTCSGLSTSARSGANAMGGFAVINGVEVAASPSGQFTWPQAAASSTAFSYNPSTDYPTFQTFQSASKPAAAFTSTPPYGFAPYAANSFATNPTPTLYGGGVSTMGQQAPSVSAWLSLLPGYSTGAFANSYQTNSFGNFASVSPYQGSFGSSVPAAYYGQSPFQGWASR